MDVTSQKPLLFCLIDFYAGLKQCKDSHSATFVNRQAKPNKHKDKDKRYGSGAYINNNMLINLFVVIPRLG